MKPRKHSVRLSINFSFALLIITTFVAIGYFVFSNWKASVERIIGEIHNNTQMQILSQIDKYVQTSWAINEANHILLEEELIDLHDKRQREIYFANVIKSNMDEIYSFSYGTEDGEYYGARRNQNNEIEAYENSAATEHRSRYFSLSDNLTAAKLVQETGVFDARTRDWYLLAKQAKTPVFSPVYKHFVMDDLTISAAYPLYNSHGALKGVLGTHLTLATLNNYLKDLIDDIGGTVYIVEKNTGALIANSRNRPNFTKLPGAAIQRILLNDTGEDTSIAAYEAYMQQGQIDSIMQQDGGRIFSRVFPYENPGLSWLIIVSIPSAPFTAGIMHSIWLSILVSSAAILLAIFLYIKNTERILKPIYNLIETTEKFSAGVLTERAKIFHNDEIGELAQAFNKMAAQLYDLVHRLEEKIKDRTAKLERTNRELALRTQELKREKDLVVQNYNQLSQLHDIAAQVQEGFLPTALENEFVAASYIYKPLQKLSGDMLDFTWLPNRNTLSGFIVDVSGHGLLAALRTNIVHGLLHQVYLEELSLPEKMQRVNRASLRYFNEYTYATVIYFEIDFNEHVLRFSAGGNNTMLAFCRQRQGWVRLPGSLVGMFAEEAEYGELVLPVQPGDVFVFGSDGLFEVLDASKLERLDHTAVLTYLQQQSDADGRWDDASAICISIKGEKTWPLYFDLTRPTEWSFICLRIRQFIEQVAPNIALEVEAAVSNVVEAIFAQGRAILSVRIKCNRIGRQLVVRIRYTETLPDITVAAKGRILYNKLRTELMFIYMF